MYEWRPKKWVPWGVIGAGLPFLAAGWLQTGSVTDDISARATSALTASGASWAAVTKDGRDYNIAGDATSQAAIDAAVSAVKGTYGVRTVTANGSRVVEPIVLAPPTVESISTNLAAPEIKGTWPEGLAKTLTVKVADTAYALGTAPELTSAAGIWSLKPAALPDGEYAVTAEVSDGVNPPVAAAQPAKVVIDTVVPALPVIAPPPMDAVWPYPVTGTWPEGDAVGLAAKLGGKTYALNTDKELTSDGKGNFSFAAPANLVPGTYDVDFAVNDVVGNISTFVAKAAIVVPEPKPDAVVPPPPKPVAAPTVDAATYTSASPTITGNWEADAGRTLSVSLAKKTYVLAKDAGITADSNGKWSLTPPAPLANGIYDVVVEVSDSRGQSAKDATVGEVEVAVPPPIATPTVDAAIYMVASPKITGKWEAAEGRTLTVVLDNKTYTLAKDAEIASDADGIWTVTPTAPLANGTYEVVATVTDGFGQTATDASANEVQVAVAPPPPPAPEPVAPVVPEPTPIVLTAPTVDSSVGIDPQPTITGTWGAGVAKSLSVFVDGQAYVLGKDFALLSDSAGKWTLKPQPLAVGTYNVIAVVGDGAKATMRDTTRGEVQIDAAPAPEPVAPVVVEPTPIVLTAPTVDSSVGIDPQPTITGTWGAGVAKSLSVFVDGQAYVLGKDFALLTDSAGKWTLKPQPLAVGTYNAIAVVGDGAKATMRDTTRGEVVINAAPAPEPVVVVEPPPYDCVAALTRISAVFPIKFAFNRTVLETPYDLTTNQYASLLMDPRCVAEKVELVGHADFLGAESYNQGLSEKRAQRVVDVFTKAGVDPARMTVKGMSENAPVDPEQTDEARQKNRRVEITIVK